MVAGVIHEGEKKDFTEVRERKKQRLFQALRRLVGIWGSYLWWSWWRTSWW
jgi:hypothetical protein